MRNRGPSTVRMTVEHVATFLPRPPKSYLVQYLLHCPGNDNSELRHLRSLVSRQLRDFLFRLGQTQFQNFFQVSLKLIKCFALSMRTRDAWNDAHIRASLYVSLDICSDLSHRESLLGRTPCVNTRVRNESQVNVFRRTSQLPQATGTLSKRALLALSKASTQSPQWGTRVWCEM